MLDESRVKKIMGTVLEVDPEEIDLDSSMDNVEKWDSLRQMNLVLALEDAFSISIPDEDAANATSYRLILLVLSELLGD
ncbi:MAG: phosphopantetheine-binding protein [Candidatus Competibacteraceae bacterium]|jgi:acyl carrier protein